MQVCALSRAVGRHVTCTVTPWRASVDVPPEPGSLPALAAARPGQPPRQLLHWLATQRTRQQVQQRRPDRVCVNDHARPSMRLQAVPAVAAGGAGNVGQQMLAGLGRVKASAGARLQPAMRRLRLATPTSLCSRACGSFHLQTLPYGGSQPAGALLCCPVRILGILAFKVHHPLQHMEQGSGEQLSWREQGSRN